MSIVFRTAIPADAAALAEFGARSFCDTFGHLYDPADLALFLANHRPAVWASELSDPGYAVRIAEAERAILGFAKLGPPQLPFTPRGEAAELRQLYVLAPHHGRGIAQALMDWVIASARQSGADNLYLSVVTDNHRARRFYDKLGFVAEGSYQFMVGNHADEDIVMRLAL